MTDLLTDACVILFPEFLLQATEWTDSFSRTCALVVGINKYKKHDPLKNAVKDAKAVEEGLRSVKVDRITSALDCDIKELTEKINEFSSKLRKDDVAIVYLAAHGAMYRNRHVFLTTTSTHENIRETSLSVQELLTMLVTGYLACTLTFDSYDSCASKCAALHSTVRD